MHVDPSTTPDDRGSDEIVCGLIDHLVLDAVRKAVDRNHGRPAPLSQVAEVFAASGLRGDDLFRGIGRLQEGGRIACSSREALVCISLAPGAHEVLSPPVHAITPLPSQGRVASRPGSAAPGHRRVADAEWASDTASSFTETTP